LRIRETQKERNESLTVCCRFTSYW